MDKEHLELENHLEFSGHNEERLDQQKNQLQNLNVQGSILFSQKPVKKKRAFKWNRIRTFLIKHTTFQRMMEFSCHPSGIHLLHQAVFYSDNGCKMCKVYVEKNLF